MYNTEVNTHTAYKEQEAARISLKKTSFAYGIFICLFTNSVADVDEQFSVWKGLLVWISVTIEAKWTSDCNLLKKKCHSTVFTFSDQFVLRTRSHSYVM